MGHKIFKKRKYHFLKLPVHSGFRKCLAPASATK